MTGKESTGQSGAIVLESRYIEPLAKKIAAMIHFEVTVGGGYITFCENRSKGTRGMCLHTENSQRNVEAYPADEI